MKLLSGAFTGVLIRADAFGHIGNKRAATSPEEVLISDSVFSILCIAPPPKKT
jgi:hypothetical protein